MVAGRAPWPLHGARGRSGVPLVFCATLAHPFRSKGGVVCRALECKPGSLGLGKVAGRAPEHLHGARGRSGVPLAFCATLACPFRLDGGVVCRALACEPRSRGLGVFCGRSPLASARSKRAVRCSPGFFERPSRFLFARKEGWKMPRYPRWARATAFPVSCYRVSPSGGPCPIR